MKLRVYSRICRKTDLIVTILNRRKEGIKKSESTVMKCMLLHLLYAPQGQYERSILQSSVLPAILCQFSLL